MARSGSRASKGTGKRRPQVCRQAVPCPACFGSVSVEDHRPERPSCSRLRKIRSLRSAEQSELEHGMTLGVKRAAKLSKSPPTQQSQNDIPQLPGWRELLWKFARG